MRRCWRTHADSTASTDRLRSRRRRWSALRDGAGGSTARDRARGPEHSQGRAAAGAERMDDLDRRRGHDRTAGHAARARRLLRARGTLPAPFFAADDRDPRTRGRRRRGRRGLPEAGSERAAGGAGSGSGPDVSRGRRARGGGARLRHERPSRGSTRSSGRATPTSRRPRRWSRRTAPSTSSPGRARSSIVSTSGNPAWIAADLIAQAEHDPDARAILLTPSMPLARAVASAVRAADACFRTRARGAGPQRRDRRDAVLWPRRSSCRSGWRRSTWCAMTRRRQRG